jgi:hypothetical protein
MKREPHIHCPACEYKPKPEDRWACVPSCGTEFHTFWTRGMCPSCNWQWTVTQCPACGVVSPHQAWYHFPVDDGVAEDAHEEVVSEEPVSV